MTDKMADWELIDDQLFAVICEYDSGFDERSAQLVVGRERAREVCGTLNREIAGEVPGVWRIFQMVEA